MKEKDFVIPCNWENRRPLLLNQLLFIPNNYNQHEEWRGLFDTKNIFINNNPIIVEFCSGNGEWILEKAKTNPNLNWIAVEKRFDRARKIWVKMHNLLLKNLFLVFGEGFTFSKWYAPKKYFQEAFINFPDPWPKNKHAKHRLINQNFIEELAQVLSKKGKITIATDDENYSKSICKEFLKAKWKPQFEDPYFTNSLENFGSSFFERLWLSKGKTNRYMIFFTN